MSVETLMTHEVTILRSATSTDRYGNTVRPWSTTTSTRAKAWISRRSESELTDSRDGEISEWVGFFASCETIAAQDRIRWGTLTLEVAGPPNPASSSTGVHHLEVPLRLVVG